MWPQSLSNLTNYHRQHPPIPRVLVINKVDLSSERKVSEADIRNLSALWNVPYYRTSATTGLNVSDTFFEFLGGVYLACLVGWVRIK
jgi:GTPase SAR1 family protein